MSNGLKKKTHFQLGYLKGLRQLRNELRRNLKNLKDHEIPEVYKSATKTTIIAQDFYKAEKIRLCAKNRQLEIHIQKLENTSFNRSDIDMDVILPEDVIKG